MSLQEQFEQLDKMMREQSPNIVLTNPVNEECQETVTFIMPDNTSALIPGQLEYA